MSPPWSAVAQRVPVTGGPAITGKVIEFLVGKESQQFYVHEEVLRAVDIESFNTFLANRKPNANISYPSEKPAIFEVYSKWLYTRRLYIIPDTVNDSSLKVKTVSFVDKNIASSSEWSIIIMCLRLAKTVRDINFGDALIDTCISKLRMSDLTEEESLSFPQEIYDISGVGSPWRHLSVDVAVHCWTRDQFERKKSMNLPQAFLVDLTAALGFALKDQGKRISAAQFFDKMNNCRYHAHARSNQPSYRAKNANLT